MAALDKSKLIYSEQDTADKLILPYLSSEFGFPGQETLNFQAQHTLNTFSEKTGRYDGLYLSGGYPYAILEAKKYSHDLNDSDEQQARSYATSDFFDKAVPFIVVSNGREHRFLKVTATIDPTDSKLTYSRIPSTKWSNIISEPPGEVRRLLGANELLEKLLDFKQSTYRDLRAIFINSATGKFDLSGDHPLMPHLKKIIDDRKTYVGVTTTNDQKIIQFAIEAISLHFTTKILFIKLIEDLSSGAGTPRIIHTLFPREEYDLIGGLFGFKVLNALLSPDTNKALRLYLKSRRFYRRMAQDLARVTWQDIFRYGFNVHSDEYAKIFKAEHYDRFLPTEETLSRIRNELINIDTRSAILYRSSTGDEPENVIGHIYERLIDDELRNSIGAVYTPDATVNFMTDLSKAFLGHFRQHKLVEPSCGSGHFYRRIYRDYVDEVLAAQKSAGHETNPLEAHKEGLAHVFGRDIDPFAVQLTLLGTFLEQLKDNVRPSEKDIHHNRWSANHAIDTQNSLDPITINPDLYFDIEKTGDLHTALSRQRSCKRAEYPDLIIGNPPYGVKVVHGAHYADVYDLQSNDSYGYFIVNAISRLKNGARLIFIVSSSFLTITSHQKLRRFILENSKIIRIVKLHRATFPGIDIFPVIIELERCDSAQGRDSNIYHFFDLWQLHPKKDLAELQELYATILSDLESKNDWPYLQTRTARFTVRQGLIKKFSRLPIFDALPSLFEFMQDVFDSVPPKREVGSLDGKRIKEVPILTLRKRDFVQLRHIAEVKIGLQSGDNAKFYRVREGVSGGAVKGGYKNVNQKNVVRDKELAALKASERESGIKVDDPSNNRYFVPLDKPAEANIDAGTLSMFYQPIDFFVDWSTASVAEMKSLRGARFQNSEDYFKRGVSFSTTGIYSPTFRMSHGGVFDQKSSCVFSDFFEPEFLLGILGSTLLKYFVKSFINHGVNAQLDELPILIPTEEQKKRVVEKVAEILAGQKADPNLDYRPLLAELDEIVFELYGLTESERMDVANWYQRRYPALFGGPAIESDAED